MVPQGVVQRLEIVQIYKQQRSPPPAPPASHHRLSQPLWQQPPVRQVGKWIVKGKVPNLALGRLGFGNIPRDREDAERSFELDQGCRHQPPDRLSVLLAELSLQVAALPFLHHHVHHSPPGLWADPYVQLDRSVSNCLLPLQSNQIQEGIVAIHIHPVAKPVHVDRVERHLERGPVAFLADPQRLLRSRQPHLRLLPIIDVLYER